MNTRLMVRDDEDCERRGEYLKIVMGLMREMGGSGEGRVCSEYGFPWVLVRWVRDLDLAFASADYGSSYIPYFRIYASEIT